MSGVRDALGQVRVQSRQNPYKCPNRLLHGAQAHHARNRFAQNERARLTVHESAFQ